MNLVISRELSVVDSFDFCCCSDANYSSRWQERGAFLSRTACQGNSQREDRKIKRMEGLSMEERRERGFFYGGPYLVEIARYRVLRLGCRTKAEKKMKEMKASTEEIRNEMTHLINLAENCHNAFLQIREAVHPLILAPQSFDAQVDELVSAFLAQNHGD
ncbi:hypothetical protein Gohar_028153 [Gossypium harknessii]|uniref:Uncharacterized protein n=1 Tax=Gossypium harknessii TaxID=34285 RepID=A0A7J9I7P2_9ROSI|nr:hypothetical protein [Gossypium harknessii]